VLLPGEGEPSPGEKGEKHHFRWPRKRGKGGEQGGIDVGDGEKRCSFMQGSTEILEEWTRLGCRGGKKKKQKSDGGPGIKKEEISFFPKGRLRRPRKKSSTTKSREGQV